MQTKGAVVGDLEALAAEVRIHEAQGAVRAALGSCEMPDGYALMHDLSDGTFYWLRADGAESPRHYSRWEAWEKSKDDAENPERWIGDAIDEITESVPPNERRKMPTKHGFSVEKLVHFNCGHCKKWWSIGDAPTRPAWWCPWCGEKLSAE